MKKSNTIFMIKLLCDLPIFWYQTIALLKWDAPLQRSCLAISTGKREKQGTKFDNSKFNLSRTGEYFNDIWCYMKLVTSKCSTTFIVNTLAESSKTYMIFRETRWWRKKSNIEFTIKLYCDPLIFWAGFVAPLK